MRSSPSQGLGNLNDQIAIYNQVVVNSHDARNGMGDAFDQRQVIFLGQVPVQVDFSVLYIDRQAAQIQGANSIFFPQRIPNVGQDAVICSQVVVNLHDAHNGMDGALDKRLVFLLEVPIQVDFTVLYFDRQAAQIQGANGLFFPQRIPNVGQDAVICSNELLRIVFRNRHFLSTSTGM